MHQRISIQTYRWINLQKNDVSICGPLGCILPIIIVMSILEITCLHTSIENKQILYARYIDDTILLVNSEENVNKIKHQMENKSVLKFTYKTSYGKK